MGQQQLLLIVVSVIIVGIAVAVGITQFSSSAAKSNLDAVRADLQNLASEAHKYYMTPSAMAGGGNSFSGLTADAAGLAKLTTQSSNDNGAYTISTAGSATEVVLQGVGVRDGDGDGTNATVRMWVRASSSSDSIGIINR